MVFAAKLQVSNPVLNPHRHHYFAGVVNRDHLSFVHRRMTFAVKSEPIFPTNFTATVGAPSLSPSSLPLFPWSLAQNHVALVNFAACVMAVSATVLFCSAIPALLAFKRAAESLEKLMDVMREELPGTMASVRLSGMEISDLTTEISDIGQEITKGVKKSTHAVRVAEERLRRMANMAPSASLQVVITNSKVENSGPALARTARKMREGIVKGRSMIGMFFSLVQFSRLVLNYIANRRKRVGIAE